MERARDARLQRPTLRDAHITLSHGSGGKASRKLLEALILPALGNDMHDGSTDAAVFGINGGADSRVAFTTDSYVVSPLFFPGGDIGRLAVHGTINDLAMSGARPLCLSLSLIIEEGLDMEVLRRVAESIGAAAREAGVRIVTGDTKVVNRGKADQLFVNTAGIGIVPPGRRLQSDQVRAGDVVLINGFVADHGMAVMLAREALEIDADITSDSAPLHELVEALLVAAPGTRTLKDPTRGGVATSLNEIAAHARVAIFVEEEAVPVRPEVRAACEILGIDPLHIANEGKLLAVVPASEAQRALAALRSHPLGRDAAIIAEVCAEPESLVVARTGIGGSRVLDMLVGDPLPRIC
ncbi:MAG: hydrogenase expression/formation protein HypE [Longimicrobiales bacterium]